MIKCENIKLIVYDFDGVMTNNSVILREDGLESVIVNRSDGLAVEIIKKMGIQQLILSKENNQVVAKRAQKLNIPVLYGINNKKDTLCKYCNEHNIGLGSIVYIGNDINDVEVMRIVGYPVCPQDAYQEAKSVAKIIISANGGEGVVRELLNFIEWSEEALSERGKKSE
jgi:3-deoxy-D-manno-octulosonate 8-phosphate phosphatase (KDO 8-P phosphatase)